MYTIEITEQENTSLKQVFVKNENLNFAAVIYPNLGASLQQLQINNVEIIDGISPNENGLETYANRYNSSLLFPFPNRISDGKYRFKNQEFQLNCNDRGFNNALHGFVFDKPFEIKETHTEEDFAMVKLYYSYLGSIEAFPFPFDLSVTYVFNQNSTLINFEVKNTGSIEFPFGIGWHPYFRIDNMLASILNFKGENQFTMNSKMIPESTEAISFKLPLTIKKTELDDCYTLIESTCTLSTVQYDLKMTFSSEENHQFLQVYTPPNRKSIAIEPMTCIGNSFNNKIGIKTLKPKESFNWKVNLETNLKA